MKGKSLFKLAITVVIVLLVGAFAAGCPPPEEPEMTEVVVGSKEFTEQQILGQITLFALEDAGIPASDSTNLGGTDVNRSALEEGEIHTYWEYTGTAWMTFFEEEEVITEPDKLFQLVRERDEEAGLIWLDYAPLNNTYTIMMRAEHADELGIETISELVEWVEEQQAAGEEVEFAAVHEFMVREDGLPALEETYGFAFDEVHDMAIGLTHEALRNGEVDAAMSFATDGKIEELDLVNLEDDKKFFPVYNAAPVFRAEVLEQFPEIEDIMADIAPRLDDETMIYLNYRVDVEGYEPDEVAEEWLLEEGLISG